MAVRGRWSPVIGRWIAALAEGIKSLDCHRRVVAHFSAAVLESNGPRATKEVVERAVGDRRLIAELPVEAGLKMLNSARKT